MQTGLPSPLKLRLSINIGPSIPTLRGRRKRCIQDIRIRLFGQGTPVRAVTRSSRDDLRPGVSKVFLEVSLSEIDENDEDGRIYSLCDGDEGAVDDERTKQRLQIG